MRQPHLPPPRTYLIEANGRRSSYGTNREVVQRAEDALVALFPTKRKIKLLATVFETDGDRTHRQVATVFAIIQKEQTVFCKKNCDGIQKLFIADNKPYTTDTIERLTCNIEQFIERQLSSTIPKPETTRPNDNSNFIKMVRSQWQPQPRRKVSHPNAVVVHFGDDSNGYSRKVLQSTEFRRLSDGYWQQILENTLIAQVRILRNKNEYPKVFPEKVLFTVFSRKPTSSKDLNGAVVCCYFRDTKGKVRLWPPLNYYSQYLDINEGTRTRFMIQKYFMALMSELLTGKKLTPLEQELRNFIQTILDSQDQPTSDEETSCPSP